MRSIRAKEIYNYMTKFLKLEVNYQGDLETLVEGFSSLKSYCPGTLTWSKCKESDSRHITALITKEKNCLNSAIVFYTQYPKYAFFSCMDYFWGKKGDPTTQIGQGTYISEDVKIGNGVKIGHNCVLDGEIEIGDDTIIANGVVIVNHVIIGKRSEIQSLSAIGEDGFGYVESPEGSRDMIRHQGGVIIGNDVFIGSHVNIARGTIDNTIIEDGVKIAPSTHVGHNNHIHKNAVIITSMLYGSVTVDEDAYIVGSIIKNQCKVGKGSTVGMGSVAIKDVAPNVTVVGCPAKELYKR